MNFIDKVLKAVDNKYASVVSEGNDADIVSYIDTGSYALNALFSGSIYGGLPANKVSALAGEESTGKTFYALQICKKFQEYNPEGLIAYFETESAVTTEMLESRGIDTNRFLRFPVSTVEEFRSQATRFIDLYLEQDENKRQPCFMVLDSLGMLSTNKEITDVASSEDKRDMTKAPLIKGAFRVITLKLGRAKMALLVINHVYNLIGSYIPKKVMGGGSGLNYAASSIVFLSKSKFKDKTTKEVTGAVITASIEKSRLTVENKKVETLLDYENGLNRYYGLLDIASNGGLISKEGANFTICGIKTTFTNQESFENGVYKNPEKFFTKEVLDKIDEVAQKEFKYGKFSAPVEEDVE